MRDRTPDEWTADLRSLGKGTHKSIQELLAETQAHGGWRGKRLRNSHFALIYGNSPFVTVPSTPNPRSVANTRSHIRRVERLHRDD